MKLVKVMIASIFIFLLLCYCYMLLLFNVIFVVGRKKFDLWLLVLLATYGEESHQLCLNTR